MTEAERDALGNKILSTLVELYADQMGVKITYRIERKDDDHGDFHGSSNSPSPIRYGGAA